LKSNLLDGAIR